MERKTTKVNGKLSTNELAAALNVSTARIRKLHGEGRLGEPVVWGNSYYFDAQYANGYPKRQRGRPKR